MAPPRMIAPPIRNGDTSANMLFRKRRTASRFISAHAKTMSIISARMMYCTIYRSKDFPSCGAEVTPGCIAARAGGCVFNCDGDYTLRDAQNAADAHTQLYRVEKAGNPDKGVAAQLGKRIEPARILSVEDSGVESLFPKGAGELHVYGPVEL